LQNWFRDRIENLNHVRNEVKERFRIIERDVLSQQEAGDIPGRKRHAIFSKQADTTPTTRKTSSFDEQDHESHPRLDSRKTTRPATEDKRLVRQSTATATGRWTRRSVADELVDDRVLNKFLRLELRSARHRALTKAQVWQVHMEAYNDEVTTWRIKKQAFTLMGFTKEQIREECPVPVRPPYEHHVPTDAELQDWVARCREDPSKITPRPMAGKRIPIEMNKVDPEAEKFNSTLDIGKVGKENGKNAPPSARDFLPRVTAVEEEQQFTQL
jgi:hypothetical protein